MYRSKLERSKPSTSSTSASCLIGVGTRGVTNGITRTMSSDIQVAA